MNDHDAPLVRDVFPGLAADLVRLLGEEGEHALAICAHDLRMVRDCGCGDDSCQSFSTAPHEPGVPFGPGHRTVCLFPGSGYLNLDVVHGRIMYAEVLDRPAMRRAAPPRRAASPRPASPRPAGGAEAAVREV
ncbi:hypothetical protein ACFWSF_01535 [Streptomyces sp. NPDC058611]|uniref:hypothetical protein n=1 Tax=unclassified Streptomyces TaxID=2593676 RepID=UPI00365428E3